MNTPPLAAQLPLHAVKRSAPDALLAAVNAKFAKPMENAPAPKRQISIVLPFQHLVPAVTAADATAPAAFAAGAEGPALVVDATMFMLAFDEDV
jgi:hypothetical protein